MNADHFTVPSQREVLAGLQSLVSENLGLLAPIEQACLRLTGRVDMRAVERTVHPLINNGFEPRAYPDLYGGLVYTAFQERATKVSHLNVAKLAAGQGNEALDSICRRIAGDEARPE